MAVPSHKTKLVPLGPRMSIPIEKKKCNLCAQLMNANESRETRGPSAQPGSNPNEGSTLPCITRYAGSVALLLYTEHDSANPLPSFPSITALLAVEAGKVSGRAI